MDFATGPFPLDDSYSATTTLPDGRKLGYAQYGLPDGIPIICLHGLPGSRIDFARFHQPATDVGARIISVDRPGIGLSSPDPTGTLLTVATDIGHLGDALGLEEYAVLGGSAGGPYSLACAASLPHTKLKCLAVICGLGHPDMGSQGMSTFTYLATKYASWIPSFVWPWFWSRVPEARTDLSVEEHYELLHSLAVKSTPHEREAGRFNNEDSVRLWVKTARESFANGVDGPVQDTLRLVSDWGFKVQDLRKDLPVRLWYGRYDGTAPPHVGEVIAARIGGNAKLTVVEETHGSMFANRTSEFLREIVENVKAQQGTQT